MDIWIDYGYINTVRARVLFCWRENIFKNVLSLTRGTYYYVQISNKVSLNNKGLRSKNIHTIYPQIYDML
jgi:hypothetical protein